MATVLIDVTWGAESLDDALTELTAGLELVATPTGVHAAGGWPEVRFEGERDQLEQLIERYVGDGAEGDDTASEVAFHLARVQS